MEISILHVFTAIVDFFFLTFSLWLGVFIVTRNHRSQVSWLAGAALWSLSGSFLNNLILMYSPTLDEGVTWWWGWSIAIAVPFWYHLSVSLLPKERATNRQWLNSLIYIIALNLIAMAAYTPLIFTGQVHHVVAEGGVSGTGPLYPLFAAFLIVVPLLVLSNLYLGFREAKSLPSRQRFKILIWASLFALCGAIYGGLTTWLAPEMPSVVSDLFLGVSVLLLGYSVARWNALIEGHSVRLDFLYTSIAFGCVVGIYLIAAWLSNLLFGVHLVAFMLIIVLAVITHSLYDWARSYLDRRIFGGHRYRELRENLREFSRSIPSGQELQERLGALLQILCNTLNVSNGFIALYDGDVFKTVAEVGARIDLDSRDTKTLVVDEITQISPPADVLGVPNGAMIVPLHFGGYQIGVVMVGERYAGAGYSDEDLFLLEDLADIVATVVHTAMLQEKSVEQIGTLLGEVRRRDQQLQMQMREAMGDEPEPTRVLAESDVEAVAMVEDALRHIHDFSYLGRQPLAQLLIVDASLDVEERETVTHVDRGKAVKETLMSALNKLMPSTDRGPAPPSREWHPFVILHDSYLLGKLNREVMSELYISEGTFNRTRRRALRGMTRALAEMESAAQKGALGGNIKS
jgi:ABC-type multidrug transport system fused ATPase/permease subunit